MSAAPTIMWFRQDLRVHDNPALARAVVEGSPVIPVYILDDVSATGWAHGGASRWWLHHSLKALGKELADRGAKLVLRRGDARMVLPALARETGASRVMASRSYEPWARDLEEVLHGDLQVAGVEFSRFAGSLLFDPDRVRTGGNGPYKVYSPFWRAVSERELRTPVAAPDRVPGPVKAIASDGLEDWNLLPTKPDWAGVMRETWSPGERTALASLDKFVAGGIRGYNEKRNRPDLSGTSRLSPHLRFGELSPAMCWERAKSAAGSDKASAKGLETYLKELVWREFSYHLLYHFPSLPETPFRPEFARFPWKDDEARLKAWQKGMTGYPIVDAGMRELWATGWMHNRVRMITGSFLVKDLMISWQRGEVWFWDCLVDADLASNSASWQWIAGSGADAAPYFRVFNPQKQGEKFDPDGFYVRRWVPELARLPDQYLHAPSTAPRDVLADAGIVLGKTYPHPIVDHAKARDVALAAFATLKESAPA